MHDAVHTTPMTLVMMPYLGGSFHEWRQVRDILVTKYRICGIDMPGFGDATDIGGYSVKEMADYLLCKIIELKLEKYVLVGHSMSGKVAMVAGFMMQSQTAAMAIPDGLILVASSPLSPEPMDGSRRAELIQDLGHSGEKYRRHAEAFVRANCAESLPPDIFEGAVGDVLQMNCAAWTAWLESGSKEDHSSHNEKLHIPALVVAGEKDKDLGPQAQKELVQPVFSSARLETVKGAAHLIPLESPAELARLIDDFVLSLPEMAAQEAYRRLIDSERVSSLTRNTLNERLSPGKSADIFTSAQRATLRAVTDRVLPQSAESIDLAKSLETQLANNKGNGWRYDVLPSDQEAYVFALDDLNAYSASVHGTTFAELPSGIQEEILRAVQSGRFIPAQSAPNSTSLSSEQMARWFEECRADVTGLYMAHPRVLAQIGYSGVADGGESNALTGFVNLGLGEKENWEPEGYDPQ